jgi:hypothetical protein
MKSYRPIDITGTCAPTVTHISLCLSPSTVVTLAFIATENATAAPRSSTALGWCARQKTHYANFGEKQQKSLNNPEKPVEIQVLYLPK